MTEWFAAIGDIQRSQAFRAEDNGKAERMEVLYQEIGLQYERPEPFEAKDARDRSLAFEKVLQERGHELCAMRLVPKNSALPKLRQRGLSIQACYHDWFLQQTIQPEDYTLYLCPHSDTLLWSAIFVVNEDAIFGEMVSGLHSQLTHGDMEATPIRFRYDFSTWEWSRRDEEAERYIHQMVDRLKISDETTQARLKEGHGAQFSHGYLQGYFETTVWPDQKIYFIDYNRLLPTVIQTPAPFQRVESEAVRVKGMTAYPGVVEGRVVMMTPDEVATRDFPEDGILVCDNTDIRFVPCMTKARAIVTNRGGILSHASIVARELKKPCIVGTGNATQELSSGEWIMVDATRGSILSGREPSESR